MQPFVRLRWTDEPSLVLEIPNEDGPPTRIEAGRAEVAAMYEDLETFLPGVFAEIHRPRPGATAEDQPYPVPINRLSARVPQSILDEFQRIVHGSRETGPPILLLTEDDPFPWELVRTRSDSLMLGQSLDVARFDGIPSYSTLDDPGLLVIAPTPTRDPGQCEVAEGPFAQQFAAVKAAFGNEKVELLDCSTATLETVLSGLGDDAHRIVHYMGHHFYDAENPMQSFVQLAGQEVLHPEDLMNRFGNAPVSPKWPWVFLNGCTTAGGDDDADPVRTGGSVWGSVLRRTGAHTAIGSYWPVEKVGSAVLANTFYKAAVSDCWAIGAALRHVRANPRPSTLLAYTLVGDPTIRVRVPHGADGRDNCPEL